MTSLHVIYGLALPPIQNPGYAYALNMCNTHSSVARGGGGGYSPPIGMSTKMQNKKQTTFLALFRLFFALELTEKVI